MPARRRTPAPSSAAGPHQLRALHQPRTARVWTDEDGWPVRVQILRRGVRARAAHAVHQVRERWRIDDEWWRAPIARMYFDLVLDTGRSLILYFDEHEGAWFVHE